MNMEKRQDLTHSHGDKISILRTGKVVFACKDIYSICGGVSWLDFQSNSTLRSMRRLNTTRLNKSCILN